MMRLMARAFNLTAVFLLLACAAAAQDAGGQADRVIMNDGTVVEGRIFRIQALHILIITPAGNKTIPMDQVQRFRRVGEWVVVGDEAAPDVAPLKQPENLAVHIDEDEVRKRFEKALRRRDGDAALAALKALAAASEPDTFRLLKTVLASDAAAVLRIAAAEAMARADDPGGALIEPLCTVLLDQKEDRDLRLACARALEASIYKEQPIDALIRVISNIGNTQRELWEFGAACTSILDRIAGVGFGADKDTPAKWQEWWTRNRAAVRSADAKTRAGLRKAAESADAEDSHAGKAAAPAAPAAKAAPRPFPRPHLSAAEKNERAARSLLALARSWHMNGNDESALRTLRKLLDQYPGANAADAARTLLREIEHAD